MRGINDSHLIYSVADSKKNKIEWNKYAIDSEWRYFGELDNVNRELVLDVINTHFMEDILYIVTTRTESKRELKHNIEKSISSMLGIDSFAIWDKEFIRVVEFNKIGTMRCGQSIA